MEYWKFSPFCFHFLLLTQKKNLLSTALVPVLRNTIFRKQYKRGNSEKTEYSVVDFSHPGPFIPAFFIAFDERIRAYGAHQELGTEQGQPDMLQHL